MTNRNRNGYTAKTVNTEKRQAKLERRKVARESRVEIVQATPTASVGEVFSMDNFSRILLTNNPRGLTKKTAKKLVAHSQERAREREEATKAALAEVEAIEDAKGEETTEANLGDDTCVTSSEE